MNSNIKTKLVYYILFIFFSITAVNAHILAGENGLLSGMFHPLFGLDHLLAMIAVGIISVQIGKKALWQVPLTFLSFMVIGGIFGIIDFNLLSVEMGIALSVIILGLAIFTSKKISQNLAMFFIGVFAIFHGFAHGAEMSKILSPITYILGFLIITTILHITGIFIGIYAKKTQVTQKLLQGLGFIISSIGIYFLMII